MLVFAALFVYFIDVYGWLIRQFTQPDDIASSDSTESKDDSKFITIHQSVTLGFQLLTLIVSNAIHVFVYCGQLHGTRPKFDYLPDFELLRSNLACKATFFAKMLSELYIYRLACCLTK